VASVDPHIVAVKALLDATGQSVFVGRADRDALNLLMSDGVGYIVLEPGQGVASTTSFEGSSDQRTVRMVTRYFGAVWQSVDALRTHARAALLDVRPTVSGRSSERIVHETEFPVDRDELMPEVVMFAGDSWVFSTWPSA
jgi:hypothetical protein